MRILITIVAILGLGGAAYYWRGHLPKPGTTTDTTARPTTAPVIQTNMILGSAFAEAIAIYALVVAIMIGFVF